MSSFPKRLVEIFAQIGSEERLSIMIVLHGSDFLRHTHILGEAREMYGCLTFSQILEATDVKPESRLSYHLSRLLSTGLIDKIAFKDSNDRVFPVYKPSEKWRNFATEFQIDKIIIKYIQEKYPDDFYDPEA